MAEKSLNEWRDVYQKWLDSGSKQKEESKKKVWETDHDGQRDGQRKGQEGQSVKNCLGHKSGSNLTDHQEGESVKDRLGWKTGSSQSEAQETTSVFDNFGPSFDEWLHEYQECLDSGSKQTEEREKKVFKTDHDGQRDGQSEGQRKGQERKSVKNCLGLKSEDLVVEPDKEPVQERKSVRDRLGQRDEIRDGLSDMMREKQERKIVKDRLEHKSSSNLADHQGLML